MVFESPHGRHFGLKGKKIMTAMLSTKELASLYTSLEAPVAVADLLDRGTPLSDDESFALTIMFSEMTAQRAVISLACCMQVIASRFDADPGLTASLKLQSDFILDDYAPLWLQQNAKGTKGKDMAEWSVYMQEDLEATCDLLMICADIFGTSSVAAAEICTILQDQAAAHAEALDHATFEADLLAEAAQQPAENPAAAYTNNVIQFPFGRRA
jgi:hypothetical protein